MFYGYLLPKCTIGKKLLCIPLFYHPWNGSHKIPLPTLHTFLNWHSGSMEGCITYKLGGNVPLCTGRLRKSFGVEARGKPSSCIALLLLCSLAATKTGGLKKAMVWVICNLQIHCGDSSSLLCWVKALQQGILGPSSQMRGMTTRHSGMGTSRQRAEAVARGGASATARMAAKNPTPWARSNTGKVGSSPITTDQQPPPVSLWGGRRRSEGPWLSAL